MSLIRNILIFVLLISISCKRTSGGRIVTKSGIEIHFHELSGSTKKVFKSSFINVDMTVSDKNNEIIFSSNFNGLHGVSSFYYDSLLADSPFNEVFLKIFAGDSVSLKVESKDFFHSFFGKAISFKALNSTDSILLRLKVLDYSTAKEQQKIINKLSSLAHNYEINELNRVKREWDKKYMNIFKLDNLYAIKLASDKILNSVNDSSENYISINYSIESLDGRLLYNTGIKPEYYDKSLNGQLLEGFKIIIDNYIKGDSIMAILPSDLVFGKRGSFVNQIPPYSPVKINLRIN
tara:strand:- start:2220 stop:3095 length:876 start_codon:yes stop_codon:yes gene_type:complete